MDSNTTDNSIPKLNETVCRGNVKQGEDIHVGSARLRELFDAKEGDNPCSFFASVWMELDRYINGISNLQLNAIIQEPLRVGRNLQHAFDERYETQDEKVSPTKLDKSQMAYYQDESTINRRAMLLYDLSCTGKLTVELARRELIQLINYNSKLLNPFGVQINDEFVELYNKSKFGKVASSTAAWIVSEFDAEELLLDGSNTPDNDTMLHKAAECNNMEMLQLFIFALYPGYYSSCGKPPWEWLETQDSTASATVANVDGAPRSGGKIQKNDTSSVASISEENDDKQTALDTSKPFCYRKTQKLPRFVHSATYGGNLRIVKFLVETLNISPVEATEDGTTPLHVSCRLGKECLPYLLERCDKYYPDQVNPVSMQGLTPLHCAVWFSNPDAVSVLLSRYAAPLSPNNTIKENNRVIIGLVVAALGIGLAKVHRSSWNCVENQDCLRCVTELLDALVCDTELGVSIIDAPIRDAKMLCLPPKVLVRSMKAFSDTGEFFGQNTTVLHLAAHCCCRDAIQRLLVLGANKFHVTSGVSDVKQTIVEFSISMIDGVAPEAVFPESLDRMMCCGAFVEHEYEKLLKRELRDSKSENLSKRVRRRKRTRKKKRKSKVQHNDETEQSVSVPLSDIGDAAPSNDTLTLITDSSLSDTRDPAAAVTADSLVNATDTSTNSPLSGIKRFTEHNLTEVGNTVSTNGTSTMDSANSNGTLDAVNGNDTMNVTNDTGCTNHLQGNSAKQANHDIEQRDTACLEHPYTTGLQESSTSSKRDDATQAMGTGICASGGLSGTDMFVTVDNVIEDAAETKLLPPCEHVSRTQIVAGDSYINQTNLDVGASWINDVNVNHSATSLPPGFDVPATQSSSVDPLGLRSTTVGKYEPMYQSSSSINGLPETANVDAAVFVDGATTNTIQDLQQTFEKRFPLAEPLALKLEHLVGIGVSKLSVAQLEGLHIYFNEAIEAALKLQQNLEEEVVLEEVMRTDLFSFKIPN